MGRLSQSEAVSVSPPEYSWVASKETRRGSMPEPRASAPKSETPTKIQRSSSQKELRPRGGPPKVSKTKSASMLKTVSEHQVLKQGYQPVDRRASSPDHGSKTATGRTVKELMKVQKSTCERLHSSRQATPSWQIGKTRAPSAPAAWSQKPGRGLTVNTYASVPDLVEPVSKITDVDKVKKPDPKDLTTKITDAERKTARRSGPGSLRWSKITAGKADGGESTARKLAKEIRAQTPRVVDTSRVAGLPTSRTNLDSELSTARTSTTRRTSERDTGTARTTSTKTSTVQGIPQKEAHHSSRKPSSQHRSKSSPVAAS